MANKFQIISFYEFKDLGSELDLVDLRGRLRDALVKYEIFGTIIIAGEGFNASLCGESGNVARFIPVAEKILKTRLEIKSSFHVTSPFRKHEVKIKPEIVTLKKEVEISLADGTHVDPSDWNALISDPDVYVLDARNDYEFRSGTFRNAENPGTEKFSDLPEFVDKALDPERNKKIAMFCTGGIRCEKFAPYLLARGFTQVYQLRGGILAYLDKVPEKESLWEGECFVFDERITLNGSLDKGESPDLSQRHRSEPD
jgi:UPF0176 protein